MITRRDRIELRIEMAGDLYKSLTNIEKDLDSLLPPDVEVAAARPLEGFFRTSVIPPPPPPLADPLELASRVGRNIKQRREQLGMTQQELAEETGIRRPNIARLERGINLPNLATLVKVAGGLESSLEAFFKN